MKAEKIFKVVGILYLNNKVILLRVSISDNKFSS